MLTKCKKERTEQIPDKISKYKTKCIHFRGLRMEATGSSEAMVFIYQGTLCHFPEERNPQV
jgi:hypothetical protein